MGEERDDVFGDSDGVSSGLFIIVRTSGMYNNNNNTMYELRALPVVQFTDQHSSRVQYRT